MNIIYKIKLYLHLFRYRGIKEKLCYSRNKEDIFLINYFKKIQKGRYIDIGAYHPFRNSNTYLLYKKGWSGINIDLSNTSIDLFKIARPNDINLNLVLADKKKKIKIYQDKNLGMMNTINPFYASIYLKKSYFRKVWSNNLNTVLKKYDFKNKKFELLDIDAEGSDYLIIKNINFKKYSFKLILIETHAWNTYTKNERKKIRSLLKSKNYNFLKQLHETSIFENSRWKD